MRKFVIVALSVLFYLLLAQSVYAQTYELNVGERYTLPYPNPPAGYVDHLGTGKCNKSDCIGIDGLQIYVYNYFTGTATVEIEYNYTYTGIDNRTHVGNGTAYYSVKCKPTEVKLSKSTLELEPGDEVELSYTTYPSSCEPEVEWRTNDMSVATLSSRDEQFYHVEKIGYQKTIKVCAKAIGTCVIKLGCNTGYSAPTCSVTVKDDRPHLTASVAAGPVKKGTKVTLTCDRVGADIRYTTDGSDPTKSSQKYTAPIEINESKTVKAKAYVNGEESRILTLEYKVYAHMPGEVFTSKSVEGVDITYKVVEDGNYAYLQVGTGENYNPSISKSYSGTITIPKKADGMDVKYIGKYAFYECNLSSVVFEDSYSSYSLIIYGYAFYNCKKMKEIKFPVNQKFSLDSYSFCNCDALETVRLEGYVGFNDRGIPSGPYAFTNDYIFFECNNIKAVYHYLNGELYAIKNHTFSDKVYDEANLFVKSNYLSKYKSRGGWMNFHSILAIGSEPNKKLSLSASPSGGEVSKETTITLTAQGDGSTVSGCDIYYTLDGSTPTKSSTKYTSSGITINKSCTLKAIAYKSGYEDSDILTVAYTIKETLVVPTSIGVSPSSKTINVGGTFTATYSLTPSNATTTVTWTSDDSSIASVDNNC